jgi:diguanylate cyclase (GGDEF)-like protein
MPESLDSEPRDLPQHPLASGALGAWLAGSEEALVGRVVEQGRHLETNPALRRLLGGSPALTDRLRPSEARRWRRLVAELREGGPDSSASTLLRFGGRAGGSGTYRVLITLDRDEPDALWLLGVAVDESVEVRRLRRELSRTIRALRRQARTDPLTGLANRGQLDRWLRQETGRAERRGVALACLMLDLDRFKEVNDTRGHLEGDRLLGLAARSLAEAVGPGGRVARFGGDEFVVLLSAADPDEARAEAERLRSFVSERLAPASGACVGVACHRPGEPPQVLLSRADAALVRAKSGGRDRVEIEG